MATELNEDEVELIAELLSAHANNIASANELIKDSLSVPDFVDEILSREIDRLLSLAEKVSGKQDRHSSIIDPGV